MHFIFPCKSNAPEVLFHRNFYDMICDMIVRSFSSLCLKGQNIPDQICCCCSVIQSCPTLCDPMNYSTQGFPVPCHLLEFAQTHVHWVNDAIQSSHPLLPSSPPALSLSHHRGLFQFRLLASGGQSIGASVSATVLPMNIQGWFPLGLTGLISLLSKRLSRVFSNTTIGRHQFFGPQPSLWSNSHIRTWLLEKT